MWTRRVLIAVALVIVFQAGRMLPAWGDDGLSRHAAAFAQTVDACTQGAASAEEPECKLVQGLIDKIALTSLERLGGQLALRTEALRPEIRLALENAARQRLGDEVATLNAQITEANALMTRTVDTLERTKKTLNRSEELIDDSDDVIDETKKVLNESEDLLEETQSVLRRSEDLLNRTDALSARLQEDLARVARLVELLESVLPRR